MYIIKTIINKIKIADLIKDYFDRERIEGYCKGCKNYNLIWSCPPHDFNTDEYLRQFENIYIIATKIIFKESTIQEVNSKEEINKYLNETVNTVRAMAYNKLIMLENEYHGSKFLNSGNCTICENCARNQNVKCRHPNRLRYSLESLGFDVGKITKELLNIELKWASNKLPEYLTLTSGFMTNYDVENSIISNICDVG